MLRKRLLNERAAGVTRGEEIRAAAEAEGREFTAEELAEFAKLKDRREAIDAQLAVLEEQREAERTMAAVGETTTPANAVANITHVHDRAQDAPWGSFGEMLVAITKADHVARTGDPRLFKAAASGASVGEPSTGGFLVPGAYSEALLARAREESPILGMCRTIPIPEGTESIDLPVIDETSRATGSRFGGVRVYRKAEADTVTASKPSFGKLKIDTSEIMGIAYATERLIRNASTVESVFADSFASEFAFKATDEIIRGGGGDEMLGILSTEADKPTVSQAKEGGQAAATINTKNLSNMWSHLPARSKSRAVWLINNDVEPELDHLTLPAGTGALEPRFVTYGPDGALRIKGRPVMQLEQCATLGTVGDIILADLNEYIVSPQGGIEQQESMHVRFLYNEMTFRWNYYINGRPAWLSALTPFKGSTKLSPFVTLATRA